MAKLQNGDFSWIVPGKFLAFSGPISRYETLMYIYLLLLTYHHYFQASRDLSWCVFTSASRVCSYYETIGSDLHCSIQLKVL